MTESSKTIARRDASSVRRTLVITSGGFDPLHAGHISAFERMAKVGDLCVIVNSDEWLSKKKEKPFYQSIRDDSKIFGFLNQREEIIRALKCVTSVVGYTEIVKEGRIQVGDCIDGSVTPILDNIVRANLENRGYTRFVFAKSGDRTHENSPEYAWCMANGVEWLEVQSDYPDLHSSKILSDWQNTKVERSWGHYLTTVPYDLGNVKVKPKVLVVKPGMSLSVQSHKHREEVWYLVKGDLGYETFSAARLSKSRVCTKQHLVIPKNTKHHLTNLGNDDLVLVEWQIGSVVDESDITRYTTEG